MILEIYMMNQLYRILMFILSFIKCQSREPLISILIYYAVLLSKMLRMTDIVITVHKDV
jgi:hypothetical protein